MIYHVRARLNEANAAELLDKLMDGRIAKQEPDGLEIVASLDRAVVNRDGMVEWSETCYCATPLHHERTTVLDRHFDEIKVDLIEQHAEYTGEPFRPYLEEIAAQKKG